MTNIRNFINLVEGVTDSETVYCDNCGNELIDTVNGWRHKDARLARFCSNPTPILDESDIGEEALLPQRDIPEILVPPSGSIAAAAAQAASDSIHKINDTTKFQKIIRNKTTQLRELFLKKMQSYQDHPEYQRYVDAIDSVCNELSNMRSIEKWSALVRQLPSKVLNLINSKPDDSVQQKLSERIKTSLISEGYNPIHAEHIAHSIAYDGMSKRQALENI